MLVKLESKKVVAAHIGNLWVQGPKDQGPAGTGFGRGAKKDEKDFYRYINQKWKIQEGIPPSEQQKHVGNNGTEGGDMG